MPSRTLDDYTRAGMETRPYGKQIQIHRKRGTEDSVPLLLVIIFLL